MGQSPIGKPHAFAQEFADVVNALVSQDGGDRSGRYLARHTSRGHTYWQKRQEKTDTLNVNDVEELAAHFYLTPYALTALVEDPGLLAAYLDSDVTRMTEDQIRSLYALAASPRWSQTISSEDELD